jgi:hypothetical protein
MPMLFLGIAFFTCWLVLSFVLQWLRGRDRQHVATNAAVGLGSWVAANAGLYLLICAQADVLGWALLVAGIAVCSGWLISPGGVHSVFTAPVALLPIWHGGQRVVSGREDDFAYWGKDSSRLAGFVVGLALLGMATFLIICRLAFAR